eukprot:m.165148 g.165148  ORF g.165148 m.165148 type:complete len:452 (+) comp15252_c0_seq15:187-1542(+)
MKIKVISRDPAEYTRSTKGDIHKVATNLDPKLHPLEAPREFQRALNAVKLERVFAKPFVAGLDGHQDGVFSIATNPKRLSWILSGACDGELRLWDLTTKKCLHTSVLHSGFVNGVCCTPDGSTAITVGRDKCIRMLSLDRYFGRSDSNVEVEPTKILSNTFFTGVDHHRSQDIFATSGGVVELWSKHRDTPQASFSWGADTVTTVKFNPVETNIFATAADDRNIALYDCRVATPIRKVIMKMRTNAICWNPMEAFNFTAANEDSNLYTFDMRRLEQAKVVHKDHVSAVLDVDYSPTGKSFVSGAYDKSIRIFSYNGGHSNEIYHTKRMQRIFCVKWSLDAKYLLSGSDEMNIRLWKAEASKRLETLSARQRSAQRYADSLKTRFKHHPAVKRIARHRHVPKEIYRAKQEKRTMEDSKKRKAANIRKTPSKKQKSPIAFTNERTTNILEEVE